MHIDLIITQVLNRDSQRLIRIRLLNLWTRMKFKAIFLTNYGVQASSLYTVDSAHARLVAEHVPVDIKVHILIRMYIRQGQSIRG